MQNILDGLKKLLTQDERLVSEKELFKNKIIELAIKLDPELIKLLLSDQKIKLIFFTEIGGVTIFDKDKFIKFISSKNFLPDSYTAFKNNIGLTENNEYISEKKEVVLSWPYKDCVLEGGQTKEDAKRDEVFWNQTLAPDEISRLLDPKVFTNAKRIDKIGEHKLDGFKIDANGNIKDNLIIKGNNLLALHSLKSRFAGKVKLIYIDPPYNTGNDSFGYNDSFNHSTWLTFMKNRLEAAKKFLHGDGIIFVQIDNREQAYLKTLMDGFFGRENFLTMITLKAKAGGGVGQESFLFDICEYILIYANDWLNVKNYKSYIEDQLGDNVKNVYNNILESFGSEKHIKDVSGGNVGQIKIFEHKNFDFKSLRSSDRTGENYYKYFDKIFRTTNPQGGLMKRVMPQIPKKGFYSIEYVPTKGKFAGKLSRSYFLNGSLIVWLKNSALKNETDKVVLKLVKNDNLWAENLHQGIAKEGIVELRAGKKPEKLLKRIVEMTTKPGEIVMDYHLGSGTTCAVAHKMGRQYIGIEQLEYGENDSVIRLKNVINGDQTGISKAVGWKGGGEFVYLELAKWNENFAEKINQAKSAKELAKIWQEMKKKAFLSYRVDPKKIDEKAKEFSELSLTDQKRFLLECLDKNQMYINYSEIDDKDYGVSKEDKKLNKEFYG